MWVGMVDVRPTAPGGALGDWRGGAYAYCAGEAPDLPAFVARLGEAARAAKLELAGIDWLAAHDALPAQAAASAAVLDVTAAARASGAIAFDHVHSYPDADDPEAARLDAMKEQVESFVGDWLDGAVDAYDAPFRIGSCAFVAELEFDADAVVAWAAMGADPAGLLRRARDAMEHQG